MSSAGAPPSPSSSPDSLSSLVVVPSDLVAMPSPPPPPPPAPPAVAADEEEDEEVDDEERPWPAMKMKLFPYAMFCVFGGMGRAGEDLLVAYAVINYLNIMAGLLSFYSGGERARFFWTLVSRVLQFLCVASTTLIMCVFIRYYMRVDGEYHVTIHPPPRNKHLAPAVAAAAEQLPPPPPEMDMC